MDEVFIDLRKYDLADRLGKDMISVDALLNELESAYEKIDTLKEKPQEEDGEPDEYDIWHDNKMMYEEI